MSTVMCLTLARDQPSFLTRGGKCRTCYELCRKHFICTEPIDLGGPTGQLTLQLTDLDGQTGRGELKLTVIHAQSGRNEG
jgi:hypothetical protein